MTMLTEKILYWAEKNPQISFDTTFVQNLHGQSYDLTPSQETALCNIIRKWNIDSWYRKIEKVEEANNVVEHYKRHFEHLRIIK